MQFCMEKNEKGIKSVWSNLQFENNWMWHVWHPYLGATSDALVDDSLVEIKCPYKGRNENIKPGPHFDFLQYEVNGNTVLKSSSKYNDQAQGQLCICF
jgi:hypothetical protein